MLIKSKLFGNEWFYFSVSSVFCLMERKTVDLMMKAAEVKSISGAAAEVVFSKATAPTPCVFKEKGREL